MTEATLYGGVRSRRVTVRDLQLAKQRGERWPMLTSYDMLTAGLFDEAGVPARPCEATSLLLSRSFPMLL